MEQLSSSAEEDPVSQSSHAAIIMSVLVKTTKSPVALSRNAKLAEVSFSTLPPRSTADPDCLLRDRGLAEIPLQRKEVHLWLESLSYL